MERSQATAVLKKCRRKMRRQIKQSGSDPMKLLTPATAHIGEQVVKGDLLFITQRRALHKGRLLQTLNGLIDDGGSEGIAAARTKRALNIRWENRNTNTAKGYWTGAPASKCVSIPVEGYVFEG